MIDKKKLLSLMTYIENAGENGASFDDTTESLNARYSSTPQNEDTTKEKVGMSIPERDHYLSLLFDESYVKGQRYKNGVTGLKLTLLGYDYLADTKKNTPLRIALRIAFRIVGGVFEKSMASIITPIVVSIFTVFLLKYLGLDAK